MTARAVPCSAHRSTVESDGAQHACRRHGHMHDYEAHVQAVEEDLEYYRTKRFEPRVLYLHRHGLVTLYDVLAAAGIPATGAARDPDRRPGAAHPRAGGWARRVRARHRPDLGRRARPPDGDRGHAHRAGRLRRGLPHRQEAPRRHAGRAHRRLEIDLRDYTGLLEAFTRALVARGALDAASSSAARATAGRGAWNGARIVARAWVDPAFKQRLLERGREAVRELGIPPGRLGKMGVTENTAAVHNVVVCTLCSCYPYDLLGDTPWWYKHDRYKERIVRDPRGTLAEMFDLHVADRCRFRSTTARRTSAGW